MQPVNWERLEGAQVQEFVAALVLLRWPNGNFITPSRGDRGVDIRVPTDGGFDIYQVKRYTRPLNTTQWRDILDSWDTFVAETASALPVAKWKLVTPWNPTNDALEKLATITGDTTIETEWIDRTQLDNWAAENPRLVDYYFGGGANRIQELMAQALLAGSPAPRDANLLSAARQRAVALQDALDEVDPFYRYQIEVCPGRVDSDEWLERIKGRSGFAMARARQVSPTHFAVTYIEPRSAESAALRPIRQEITFLPTPDSEQQTDIENFFNYGAPFQDILGSVTSAEGPPGTTDLGEGLFSFLLAAPTADDLPPLEIRAVRRSDRSVLRAVDACNIQRARGIHRDGIYISFTDPCGCLKGRLLLGQQDLPSSLTIQWGDFTSKEPAPVARTLELLAELGDEVGFELGVRGGRPIAPLVQVPAGDVAGIRDFLLPLFGALETIQRHTYTRIVIPDSVEFTHRQQQDAIRAARLLRGESLTGTWSFVDTTASGPQPLPEFTSDEFAMYTEQPLTVMLGDRLIETDSLRRVLYSTVRVAGAENLSILQAGDPLRLVPGSNREATQAAVPADAALKRH